MIDKKKRKRQKRRAREIMENIRRILMEEWDPLKVKDDGCWNEYDFLIGPIYWMLRDKKPRDEIVQLLVPWWREPSSLPEEYWDKLRCVAGRLCAVDVGMDEYD